MKNNYKLLSGVLDSVSSLTYHLKKHDMIGYYDNCAVCGKTYGRGSMARVSWKSYGKPAEYTVVDIFPACRKCRYNFISGSLKEEEVENIREFLREIKQVAKDKGLYFGDIPANTLESPAINPPRKIKNLESYKAKLMATINKETARVKRFLSNGYRIEDAKV